MTEPVYDFPYQEFSPPIIRKGSPTSVNITDRLLLTQSLWLHRTVNSATALHILQREPPGTFLVRTSNTRQQMVLCVRLSDDCGPSFIHQAYIHNSPAGIYLETSDITFPDLIRLVSHYSTETDVLPYTLRLPAAIEKVKSRKQLEAISHLGLEFWRSALNARDPLLSSASPSPLPSPPLPPFPSPNSPDIPDIITPNLIPSLKTRSPLEVSSGGGEGALCFFNPLFKPKDSGALKRSQFQRSIKVRVSTENSGSLSPPINPPPPVPSQEVVKEEEDERIAPLLASQEAETEQCQLSADQEYRKPRSSLRQRLKKNLSKGSMELGLKISQLRSTDGGDYKVPVPVTRQQESKETEVYSSNGLSPLEVQDSGSSSTEEGTSEDFGKFSPQLTRRKKKKKNGRSSFRAVSGAFLSLLSPERKVLIYIEEMSTDIQTEFGKELQEFLRRVSDGGSIIGKEKDTEDEGGSYKRLLTEVRDFMDKMKHILRGSAELQLETLSLEEQDRVLEKSLHRLILKPLNSLLVSEIHKGVEESGELERLGKNMQTVRNGGSSLLGVNLAAPTAPELEKIRHKLLRMQEKYSPCDKVCLLLQACRLVYKNIDAQDDTCGADEFLPALCYVLALCDLPQLLIHTYYTGELLPPETLVGEGGYYLTSVSASLSVLSSLHTQAADIGLSLSEWHRRRQGLPSLNDLQTVADLKHLCALKFKPNNPEDYAIVLHCGETQQLLFPDSQPQQIKAQLKEKGSHFYFCYQSLEKESSAKKDTPEELGNDR
ncbi:ras and Rab interactor 1 isoform X2 [Xenopus laevis]|uniref:Ras and Rab interactor 1 isoform X2 n=1 Tax=Xenopus laevis TaxID=8355 RepID=A0A8J1KGU1_XENLA|nr:ras and Rab interactor 1 isoform X2 [Xenopus laevis]